MMRSNYVLWLLVAILAALVAKLAQADAAPAPHVGEALHLARACRLEADFRLTDCSAIYWIAVKREARRPAHAGKGWLRVLLEYTRLYERRGARARETQALPWGDASQWTDRRNREWAKLREHATKILRGDVVDPCPAAMHWGGRTDVPTARHRPLGSLRCRSTVNNLYGVGP